MATPSFSEEIFDRFAIQWGMQGGPVFSTTIIATNGGFEQRNANWPRPLSRFTMGGDRTLTPSELQQFQAFFNARMGRAQGFRLRALMDFSDAGSGVLSGRDSAGNWTVGVPDGTSISSMHKIYASGSNSLGRRIFKPRQGSIAIYRNSVLQTENVNYTLDYTTGWLTWAPRQVVISSATNANPAVIQTATNHGLNTDELILFSGLTGAWAPVQTALVKVTVIDETHFSIPFDSTSWGDIGASSSTLINIYPQPSEALSWTGYFDTPVRFDADQLSLTVEATYSTTGNDGAPLATQVFVHLDSISLVEIAMKEPNGGALGSA